MYFIYTISNLGSLRAPEAPFPQTIDGLSPYRGAESVPDTIRFFGSPYNHAAPGRNHRRYSSPS
jgi:hypothetical protein